MPFQSHYPALVTSYLAGLAVWHLIASRHPGPWQDVASPKLESPGWSLGAVVLGTVGVLLVGQAWIAGWLIPERGALAPLAALFNQALIFLPVLIVPMVRREGMESAWLRSEQVGVRLLTGLAVAFSALVVYSMVRENAAGPLQMATRILSLENIDEAGQVLFEDLAIAILFIRVRDLAGTRVAIGLVAVLFAAAHIPAMLSTGATVTELAALSRDAGLGVAVIWTVQRSADIVWFWMLHFVMDMTQFANVSGGAGG